MMKRSELLNKNKEKWGQSNMNKKNNKKSFKSKKPKKKQLSENLKEVKKITEEINNLNKLNELKVEDYADVKGYADTVAYNLSEKYYMDHSTIKRIDSNIVNKNQLRKFFGAVRIIDRKKRKDNWNDIKIDVYLLKPMFAVAVGRNNIPEVFFELMNTCIDKIDVNCCNDEEKINNFETYVNFFEAIIAYNKYYDN